MAKMLKKIIILCVILAVLAGSFFYFHYQVYYSRGPFKINTKFVIEKGDGSAVIASKLKEAGLIQGEIYFYFYIYSYNLTDKILPGEYRLNSLMTIPDIATLITTDNSDSKQVKVTFPEGWTAKEMELRIKNNGLSADDFGSLVGQPAFFQEKYGYEFLESLPKNATLEGFLFPDTYFFSKDATGDEIIKKMLDNFGKKLSTDLRQEIKKQGKAIHEIITMASIIEGEVRSDSDRKIVSGIFWNRIKSGQALQSCATLAFVLGENKKQYSFADTRVESPYNTYLNKDLPPGPISNPGLAAIMAAIYPTQTNYNYFLSDPETGATVFSRTLEEHNANKVKYGL